MSRWRRNKRGRGVAEILRRADKDGKVKRTEDKKEKMRKRGKQGESIGGK